MEAILPAFVVLKHFSLIRKAVFAMPLWLSTKKSPKLIGLTDLQKLLRLQVKEVTSNPYSLLEAPHPIIYNELLNPVVNGGGKVPNAMSLYEEAQALILWGAVTNGNILILGIFNMLEQPALMARLRKELLGVWPVLENAPPKYEELEKLPFLVSDLAFGLNFCSQREKDRSNQRISSNWSRRRRISPSTCRPKGGCNDQRLICACRSESCANYQSSSV